MTLTEIAQEHWEWVESVGWHNKRPLEVLALIAGEIGEAVNECRGEEPNHKELEEELADIILRCVDFAQDQGIDIQQAVLNKMRKNKARGARGRLK